jgi:hypothetical protein
MPVRSPLQFRLLTVILTVAMTGCLLGLMIKHQWPFHKSDDCWFMETDAWNMLVFPLNALFLVVAVATFAFVVEYLQEHRSKERSLGSPE